MSAEAKTGNAFDIRLLWKVLQWAKPYKTTLVVCILLTIVLAFAAAGRPWLVQQMVDNHILKLDMQGLTYMALLLLGVILLEALFRYRFIYLSRWLGQSVIKDLRTTMFDHIIKLKPQYFDKTPIGTSTTRTINDIEAVNEIFTQGFIQIVADVLMLVIIMVIMIVMDWQLALISFSLIPVLAYATYLFKEGVKKAYQVVRKQVAKMNAFLQEHITGMRIVQLFNAQERELKKFQEINKEQQDAQIRSIFYYAIFFPVVEILSATTVGIMVWWGANQMFGGSIAVGTIIAFILYINLMFRPMRMLADRFNTVQMGLVASDRVFELMERDDKITNQGTMDNVELRGNIAFNDVRFSYNEGEPILKGISFELNQGETLAIVGSTGSGKTTIINVLSRFYEIDSGKITIDNNDIHDLRLEFLRSSMSIVLQDVFLFSGTILENITLRNSHINEEQVIQAAKDIGAHDFISSLPKEYHQEVLERGNTLSAGQRQLISFVRALVSDPSILILDEATSSIDTETEMIIQNAIEKLIAGRTSIVIAHRLSTIRNADKIMVMEDGHIAEIGSHDELLALKGKYFQLHEKQFAISVKEN